jgi:hypothetical protein
MTPAPAPATLRRRWPRWLRRGPMETFATVLIGLGVLMLLQPFSIVLFKYSFVTTLAGTVLFTVVARFPD